MQAKSWYATRVSIIDSDIAFIYPSIASSNYLNLLRFFELILSNFQVPFFKIWEIIWIYWGILSWGIPDLSETMGPKTYFLKKIVFKSSVSVRRESRTLIYCKIRRLFAFARVFSAGSSLRIFQIPLKHLSVHLCSEIPRTFVPFSRLIKYFQIHWPPTSPTGSDFQWFQLWIRLFIV